MIRLIKPYISFEEVSQDIKDILDSGFLTRGHYSQVLPEKIKEYTGAEHAFLTTSATTALTMCLKILNIGPGDEVIVSDFSFPASVNVVEDVGARPVFADVSLDTFNMLESELKRKISNKTKAVIFVDVAGNPSGITNIAQICKQNSIPLIEDAACAIGSVVGRQKVGVLADLTCFSFHPRKLLTSGEGGTITTNNSFYAEALSAKLLHGANSEGVYVTYGYNYRLPEISCLLAYKQFEKLDSIISERRMQAAYYSELLTPLGFRSQKADSNVYHNTQSVIFIVPAKVNRDGLITYLRENNIESTLGTYCLSLCDYYLRKYNDVQPNASYLQDNTICLPCYTSVPIDEVVSSIRSYCT